MKILAAPASFGPELSAVRAADILAEAWLAVSPQDSVRRLPLPDGTPGFVDAVRATRGGEISPVPVSGMHGEDSVIGILWDAETALIDCSDVLGWESTEPGRLTHLDLEATTVGIGQALRTALDQGARRIILAVGPTKAIDGGAGVLAGLGLDSPALRRGNAGLTEVARTSLWGLEELAREFREVEILVAAASDAPLTGPEAGIIPSTAPAAQMTQDAARNIAGFAHLLERASDQWHPRDLLGTKLRLGRRSYSGAGNGVAFVLATLGASVVDAAQLGVRLIDAEDSLRPGGVPVDVVLTGQRRLDAYSLDHSPTLALASLARSVGIGVVGIAGELHLNRLELAELAVDSAYALDESGFLPDPWSGAEAALAGLGQRIAITWSAPWTR